MDLESYILNKFVLTLKTIKSTCNELDIPSKAGSESAILAAEIKQLINSCVDDIQTATRNYKQEGFI